MNKRVRKKINILAGLFYKTNGYNQEIDYDYSSARHPQERAMWNQALIAYCFFNNENKLLKYQV